MHMRDAFAAVILLGLFPAFASAQRLPVSTYGVEDGLPSAYVLHVLQDSRRFLWFGTRDGLARFDGIARHLQRRARTPRPHGQLRDREPVRRALGGHQRRRRVPLRSDRAADVRTRRAGGVESRAPACADYDVPHSRRCGLESGQRAAGGSPRPHLGGHGQRHLAARSTIVRIGDVHAAPGDAKGTGGDQRIAETPAGEMWAASDDGLFKVSADDAVAHHAIRPDASGDAVTALLLHRTGQLGWDTDTACW